MAHNTKLGLASLLFAAFWMSDCRFAGAQTFPTTAPSTTTIAPTYYSAPASRARPADVYGQYPNSYESRLQSEFEPGHFELSLGGQGFSAHGHHETDTLGFVTGNFNFYVATGLSIGIEAGMSPGAYSHHHHDHGDDDNGLRAEEAMALARWHFLIAEPLTLYIDGGIGGLHAHQHFPNSGRADNGLLAVGGGLTWRLAEHWYLDGGARFARLSAYDYDAGFHGHHVSDGVQYYAGFSFLW